MFSPLSTVTLVSIYERCFVIFTSKFDSLESIRRLNLFVTSSNMVSSHCSLHARRPRPWILINPDM